MFHEDIHWAIDELFSKRTDDFNALYESLYKSRHNDCNKIRECYSDNSEAIKRNEVIANIAEVAFVKGKMNIVIDKLDNEGQLLFNEILNHIGYETSRSQNEHPSGGRITDNYSGGHRENKERRQELRDKGTISQTQREREVREEVTNLGEHIR